MDASGLLHAETEDEGDGEGTQDLIWDQAGQSENLDASTCLFACEVAV